jgi:hypothetical protein
MELRYALMDEYEYEIFYMRFLYGLIANISPIYVHSTHWVHRFHDYATVCARSSKIYLLYVRLKRKNNLEPLHTSQNRASTAVVMRSNLKKLLHYAFLECRTVRMTIAPLFAWLTPVEACRVCAVVTCRSLHAKTCSMFKQCTERCLERIVRHRRFGPVCNVFGPLVWIDNTCHRVCYCCQCLKQLMNLDWHHVTSRQVSRFSISTIPTCVRRGSAVGIATGYELDERGVEFESR